MKIEIDNLVYEVIESNCDVDSDLVKEKLTDYFYEFDYVLGDFAYGKLRLKGFNDVKNKNFKPINDFKLVHKYIEENCAFGCKYFILKKISKK